MAGIIDKKLDIQVPSERATIQEEKNNHFAKLEENNSFSMDVVHNKMESIDSAVDEQTFAIKKREFRDIFYRYKRQLENIQKRIESAKTSDEEMKEIMQENETLKEENARQAYNIRMFEEETQKLNQEKNKLEIQVEKLEEENKPLNLEQIENYKQGEQIRKIKAKHKQLEVELRVHAQKEKRERPHEIQEVSQPVQVPDSVRQRNIKDIKEFEERIEGHRIILDQLTRGSSDFGKQKQKLNKFERDFLLFKKMKRAKTKKEEDEILITGEKKSTCADVINVNNHKVDMSEMEMEDDNSKILPELPPKPNVPTTTVQKFNCQRCPRILTTAAGMKSHMESMHQRKGSKTEKCMLCPFSSRQSSAVWRHIKSVHTNERLYRCKICLKLFLSSQGWKQHEEAHDKKKPGYEWKVQQETIVMDANDASQV